MVAAHGVLARVLYEETACPLCGASDERELLTAAGDAVGNVCRLARCRRRDMACLNLRPTTAAA